MEFIEIFLIKSVDFFLMFDIYVLISNGCLALCKAFHNRKKYIPPAPFPIYKLCVGNGKYTRETHPECGGLF